MISVLVFIAVFLGLVAPLLLIAVVRGSPSAGVQRRLRRLENDAPTAVSKDTAGQLLPQASPLEKALFDNPLLSWIKRLIEHSGLPVRPSIFLTYVLITAVSVLAVVYLLGCGIVVALAAMAATGYLPFLYLADRKKRRQKKFAEQLPEALSMIARSLRAGHSLTAGLELIAQEMPQPTSGLFKTAYEQQQLGMTTPDSLSSMTAKMDSIDLHFFVTIIKLSSESGGNLAEILEKLAETVKSRVQIWRQVQTYTAEGRISGYVLLSLPLVVFMVFYEKNPAYMEVFFTVPVCRLSLFAAAFAQLVGFFIMRKIVDIRI